MALRLTDLPKLAHLFLVRSFNSPNGLTFQKLTWWIPEWTHLSDLTSNQIYAELSQKGEFYLLAPQPALSEPWPGLVGTNVNLTSGLFEDALGGWVGGDDSFYE